MNLKINKVNYFDFGIFEATEMKWIIKTFQELDIDNYSIYGFEAYTPYYENIKKMFIDNNKVNIFNKAVSNQDGESKLYLSRKGPEGHSIINTKINLSDKFITVDIVDISKWIKNNVDDFENSINIIRMNIEGAEINVFDSLINSGLHKNVYIFCGSLSDIHKIGLTEGEKISFLNRLKDNNIEVMYLCKDKPNSIDAIKNRLKDV